MIEVSGDEFQAMINRAAARLPEPHKSQLKNVALLWAEEASQEQLDKGNVPPGNLLFGLYEGVPLSRRQGVDPHLPDKITLFKKPLELVSRSPEDLQQQIYHTLWHEVAHYYGLDHDQIHAREP